jgi:hypothetical protein
METLARERADVTDGFIDGTSISSSVVVLKLALEDEAYGDKLVPGGGNIYCTKRGILRGVTGTDNRLTK